MKPRAKSRPALALLATLLSVAGGCVSGAYEPHVRVSTFRVADKSGHSFGHGVLLSPRRVLTVDHVVPDDLSELILAVSRADSHRANAQQPRYVRARVLRRLANPHGYEGLVLLDLAEPIACPEYPRTRPLAPGDSGSPVLGARGEVVGLISALRGEVSPSGKPRVLGIVTLCPLPPLE